MKIGIIGIGNIGGTLARKLSAAGHDVRALTPAALKASAHLRTKSAQKRGIYTQRSRVRKSLSLLSLCLLCANFPLSLFDQVPSEATIIDKATITPGHAIRASQRSTTG